MHSSICLHEDILGSRSHEDDLRSGGSLHVLGGVGRYPEGWGVETKDAGITRSGRFKSPIENLLATNAVAFSLTAGDALTAPVDFARSHS
jgi:hypothetical protein